MELMVRNWKDNFHAFLTADTIIKLGGTLVSVTYCSADSRWYVWAMVPQGTTDAADKAINERIDGPVTP